MGTMASQITSLTSVYSTVYSDADQQRKSKHRVTGLCAGNSPGTGEFPAQMASKVEKVSIWWRHHATFLHAVHPHILLKGNASKQMINNNEIIITRNIIKSWSDSHYIEYHDQHAKMVWLKH